MRPYRIQSRLVASVVSVSYWLLAVSSWLVLLRRVGTQSRLVASVMSKGYSYRCTTTDAQIVRPYRIQSRLVASVASVVSVSCWLLAVSSWLVAGGWCYCWVRLMRRATPKEVLFTGKEAVLTSG